jgi:hypothetical protein
MAPQQTPSQKAAAMRAAKLTLQEAHSEGHEASEPSLTLQIVLVFLLTTFCLRACTTGQIQRLQKSRCETLFVPRHLLPICFVSLDDGKEY